MFQLMYKWFIPYISKLTARKYEINVTLVYFVSVEEANEFVHGYFDIVWISM